MYFLPLPDYRLFTLSDIANFECYVDKETQSPCHIWKGSRTGDNGTGYERRCPTFKYKNISYTATRIAYVMYHKIDPGNYCVCHDCKPNRDNNLCVNPVHLWLGTQSENIKDCVEKGRSIKLFGYKLTHEMVIRIRKEYDQGKSAIRIAEDEGLARTYVHRIINRSAWNEVP